MATDDYKKTKRKSKKENFSLKVILNYLLGYKHKRFANNPNKEVIEYHSHKRTLQYTSNLSRQKAQVKITPVLRENGKIQTDHMSDRLN